MRIFLCLFLLLSSCAPKKAQKPENTLRICFAQDPSTLDPRRCSDFTSSTLVTLLYEGLTRCGSGSDVCLALAEQVTISPDGKIFLFRLRRSFWSDGHEVKAIDFEKSWKKILTPTFPSPSAYLLYPIKNGESFAKGLCSESEVGVHALEDLLLEVELEQATPYFLSLTAFPLYLPTPSHTDAPVYNGPFVLEKMTFGREILLTKNEKFWDPKQIHLDHIHISIISDEMTAINLFEKGEIDITGSPLASIGIDSLPLIKKDFPIQFLPMAASTFCTLNTKTFPFSNKSLRKAFAKTIQNHPMLTEEILLSGQVPATGMLPPMLAVGLNPSEYKKEEALLFFKLAMEELQITPQDLESITLYYRGSPMEKKIAQTLQKIWKETFNITIQLEQVDPKNLIQKLYAKNYQLSLISWIAQFCDPINLLERFKEEENQKNYPGWSSDPYREELNNAYRAQTSEERLKSLARAELLLEEEAPLIPLYHWRSPLLLNPRVQGFSMTSVGGVLLERCSIEPELSVQHR